MLKVLSSALSGGTEDHHSWNQKEYMRRKYPKHISFLEYKRASGHKITVLLESLMYAVSYHIKLQYV